MGGQKHRKTKDLIVSIFKDLKEMLDDEDIFISEDRALRKQRCNTGLFNRFRRPSRHYYDGAREEINTIRKAVSGIEHKWLTNISEKKKKNKEDW